MKVPRITAAQRKAIEIPRDAHGRVRKGGILLVPPMATDAKEWERRAMAEQRQLLEDVRK
jgi:hypothetical protein